MDREEAQRLLRGGGSAQWNRRRGQGESIPDLSYLDLRDADLGQVDFSGADLTRARLRRADLSRANFNGAVLKQADLRGANLSGADLTAAFLNRADLAAANLSGARCRAANLRKTVFAWTMVACDLSQAIGLDDIIHQAPSLVSDEALRSFRRKLPRKFLQGCGLRAGRVEQGAAPRVTRQVPACFLVHHQDDADWAKLLQQDVQEAGIGCWRSDIELLSEEAVQRAISQSSGFGGNLVLVVSRSSLSQPEPAQTISRALHREAAGSDASHNGSSQKSSVALLAVCRDDYALNGWEHDCKDVLLRLFVGAANYGACRDGLIQRLRGE